MEIVLEFPEIVRLVREGLAREGVKVPDDFTVVIRNNHKKGSIRLVFKEKRPPKPAR